MQNTICFKINKYLVYLLQFLVTQTTSSARVVINDNLQHGAEPAFISDMWHDGTLGKGDVEQIAIIIVEAEQLMRAHYTHHSVRC